MEIQYEKVEIKDASFPIKTYVKDTNEDRLHSEPHIHEQLEFVYMIDGALEFVVEDDATVVEAGDVIIIKSLVAHWSNKISNDYARMCLLQFNINLLYGNSLKTDRHFANLINRSNFKYKVLNIAEHPDNNRIAKLLLNIAEEYKNKDTAYDLAIMSDIYKLFTILYRRNIFVRPNESSNIGYDYNLDRIHDILGYIEEHFGENLSVEDAAKMLNINYSYFCRLFKKATGMTFVEYLNYYRVGIAKKKLLRGNDTVTEIMIDTGFSSHSYFNRVFKKYTGFSPTEYRSRFSNK